MDINTLSRTAEGTFFTEGFMRMIEDHLTYLRTQEGVVVTQLSNTQCVKYAGDFYGLLIDLKIAVRYHYTVMRVNDLFSPADFTGEINQVIIPNLSQIDMLKEVYQTGS